MKTQLKRLSKSTLAVILSVCLLVSCMTVGIIATDAAKTTDEKIGANEYNKTYVYVDISAMSGATVNGINTYSNTNCSDGYQDWISSSTNMGDGIFRFEVLLPATTRGFKVVTTWGTNTIAVGSDATKNCIVAVTDGFEKIALSWSTYPPLTTPTTMTATVSHSKSGGARIVSGNGTVSVDGGTASSTTATETVERGSSVIFTATPDPNYSFAGWYSDEACTTRLSTSTSYTVTASSDTTVYAAFNKEHYYLVGKFYQANLAKERIEDNNSTSFAFTQSPSDPALYTYTDDFMFKYDSASSQYRLQYISIGYGGTRAYNTSSAGAASGTAASGTTDTNAHNDGVNKWTCGDLSTPLYPPSDLNNCYKTVTFTWNAITETLSWTITDIDMTQYTAMYINCGSTWTWDHLYLANNQGDLNTIFIPGTPYIVDSGVTYNVILVKNSTIGDKTLGFKYQKAVDSGESDQSGEFTVTKGSTSKSDLTSNNWAPDESYTPPGVVYDRYYLAGQYTDGSTQFFGEKWNTTNNELTRNGANYTKTFTTNIPAGTIQFKVVKNGAWENGSWPAENQSYVIRENATSVTFTFDPNTHTTTVTQTNSGGGASGDWIAGDKYTSTGTNSNQQVADTPNIGTTSSTYKYVWADNDNGPGISGTTAISLVQNASSGNIGYWAEVSDQTLSGSNFFFALSDNSNNSGIRGNKEETINCVVPSSGSTTSSGDAVNIYNSNHEQVFQVGRQERSEVTGSAYFIKIVGVDTSKVSAIGVMAYYNGSGAVDYQIYFKEKGATPVVQTKVVDICAKDATLRDDTFNRFARLATTTIDSSDAACFEYTDENGVTYSSITAYNNAKDPDIVITRESYGGTDAGYTKMTNVPVGAKVKIKTTLSSNSSAQGSFDNKAFKETHYVKGYSFNGVTYQINEWESDGVYEEIWTVRAVNTTYKDSNGVERNATTDGKTVEVTPIYYMKNNTNCKTFYIDGYDGTVQNAWGNMLAVYPYYEGKNNKDNAFGGYPGQPMLLWGGKYQMEIPLTVDGTASGASVKGLTLHNAYWDLLHRSIDIRCNARNHAQTYDYDDFYKLYKEKNPDTIIFDFKYRTAEDNYLDGYEYTRYTFADGTTKQASDFTGDGHNGVEIVTDYFGRQVDAFGNLIADANKSRYGEDNGNGGTVGQSNEILFVSTGYKDTYVGEYATIWAVYQSNGTFIGYISSSMLYLNNIDRRLQYTGGDSTDSGRMSWSNFISTYNTLKSSYTGVPALIVYDREIWNDSKDKAYRSDGKWYYSNKSDKISANIKIQYGAYSLYEAPDHSVSSDAWNDDPFNENKTGVGGYNNIGTNTGCSAYFTNTTPNLNGKVASGEQFADSTKKFTFQAVPSGSYMFAGWVRYSNGKYYKITENEIGESPMSSNDVYIARFVTAKTGTLTVQHVVEQTNDFNGTGTPSVTVDVKNNNTSVLTEPITVSDGSKIDISKWIDARNATYTIDISMTTTPTNESFMKNIASSSGNYAASPNTWNEGYDKTNSSGANTDAQTATVASFTVQQILDSGITSLRYVSHLMKPVYTYQYEIVYTYTSRFWGTQSYTQSGTCEDGDFTGSKTTAKLNTDFIINKTPYEKSFRQQIDWNYTTTAVPAASGTGNVGASAMKNNVATDQGSNIYKMTAHVYASKTVNDKVTAEFVLPYKYNEKAQGYTVKDTDVYNISGTKSGTSYLYDSGNESVTLSTKAYSLFTYDDENHTGSDDVKASSLPLMEAAPYLMTNLGDNDYHYKLTDNMRYYTGKSFKVGDTTYYLSQDDVPQNPGTYKVLAASDSVTFTKIKYAGTDHTTTYHFAVEDTSGGAKGEYGYKVYFFSYIADEFGNYVDNEGHSVNSPIFNGQYCVYSVGREKDGIIAETGVKKYFTRWDIYNTKGDFVASCYNRRFNYSGYDNYVVRPIYESDTENSYASSTGDGYKSQITFLDDSRNQWNNGASGDYNRVTNLSDANYAGDKIFTDFAITYAYEGRNINTVSSDEAKIRVGMVIEKLDALDTVGSTTISDASYYANKYKGDTDWEALSTALAGGTSLTTAVRSAGGASSAGHSCFNSKIASNYDETGYTRFGNTAPGAISGQEFVVDNFNRLQWFYTFNNSTKTTAEADTVEGTMKNYAFRAISYIIVEKNGTKTATLTDTPVYFTIYDTATRAHN